MKDRLFKEIEALQSKYVSIWTDVCLIESPTDSKAGVDAVGRYFTDLAKQNGWKLEVFEQPVAGHVISVTMNADVAASPIALSGHMDTVHPIGSFPSPTVRIEDDVIYGPGVCDCKGGIVAGFLAMEALQKCGFDKRPVVMYLQSDEEGGGKFSNDETIRHICQAAQGAVAFLNLEGGASGQICSERKGIASFEITVTGQEAHSARCATLGANAILQAAQLIVELEKYKDANGLTCCCTLINGGTKHNVVPGQCQFTANVRFVSQKQLNDFHTMLNEMAANPTVNGCSIKVVLPRVRPSLEENQRNLALIDRLNKIWVEAGMEPLTKIRSLGGSDAANASVSGLATVDNLGVFGGNAHNTKEYAIVSSLAHQAKRIALAALYI